MSKTKTPAPPNVAQLVLCLKAFSHADPWLAEYSRALFRKVDQVCQLTAGEADKDPIVAYLATMAPQWTVEFAALWRELAPQHNESEEGAVLARDGAMQRPRRTKGDK